MTQSVTQRAYDHLRSKLASGDLQPGTRLVTRALAKEVGGSLIPVREALSRLASEGLVEHVPGGGSYVRRIGRLDLKHIYEMREAVESFAAAQAAARISESQLEVLQEICDEWHAMSVVFRERDPGEQHATADEITRWLKQDRRYHDVIITAASNPYLTKSIADLRLMSRVHNPLRKHGTYLTVRHAARSWRQHTALVRALRSGDSDLAREWMVKQIRSGKESVLGYLDRQMTHLDEGERD